jgi:competence protein ComEC
MPEPTATYLGVLEAAERERATWLPLTVGRHLELDGVMLRALHPAPVLPHGATSEGGNDRSVVIELRFGSFSALLTGDAEAPAERWMLERGLARDVDVLKVGHHGSRTSTVPEFLDRVRPEVALVPVGRRNRYGHPHPSVLARLEAQGARVHRTDRDGSIRVLAKRDGSYRVETAR